MIVELSYRDGANYKCRWDVQISDKYRGRIKIAQNEDDHIHLDEIGLSMSDIPLVQEYGQTEDDHNFVLVEAIK